MKRVAILARIVAKALSAFTLTFLLSAAALAQLPEPTPSAPLFSYRIVHEYPHDTHAYTEGLVYVDGKLYESTGLVGHSSLRMTDLKSGRVLKKLALPDPYFGEGLAESGSRWFQLTWKDERGFIYDQDLHRVGSFSYRGEGWGLTFDGQSLIMSNGTPVLQRFSPADFSLLGTLPVHADDEPIAGLNELEYAGNRIYANIWQTDRIAVIDPATGSVTGWLDMSALHDRFKLPPDWNPVDDVLNGIAFDPHSGHLFVTGKCWPKLFEIAVAN
jgi:glutaminyl-peptide cyclotransferase